jgi:hypothetical protein
MYQNEHQPSDAPIGPSQRGRGVVAMRGVCAARSVGSPVGGEARVSPIENVSRERERAEEGRLRHPAPPHALQH